MPPSPPASSERSGASPTCGDDPSFPRSSATLPSTSCRSRSFSSADADRHTGAGQVHVRDRRPATQAGQPLVDHGLPAIEAQRLGDVAANGVHWLRHAVPGKTVDMLAIVLSDLFF